ncbi:hypothetical protein L7F22_058813 [Adiantum nelumboides]|nr:hypothetical protein [Adiantum nelumboides]
MPLPDEADMVMHNQVILDEDACGTEVADKDRLAPIVHVSSALGSLMSDLLVSRPDLAYSVGAFAVGVVSRAMTDTGIVHSGALQVVTRYLQQECHCGSGPNDQPITDVDVHDVLDEERAENEQAREYKVNYTDNHVADKHSKARHMFDEEMADSVKFCDVEMSEAATHSFQGMSNEVGSKVDTSGNKVLKEEDPKANTGVSKELLEEYSPLDDAVHKAQFLGDKDPPIGVYVNEHTPGLKAWWLDEPIDIEHNSPEDIPASKGRLIILDVNGVVLKGWSRLPKDEWELQGIRVNNFYFVKLRLGAQDFLEALVSQWLTRNCALGASTSFTHAVDEVFDLDAILTEHKNFEGEKIVEGGDEDILKETTPFAASNQDGYDVVPYFMVNVLQENEEVETISKHPKEEETFENDEEFYDSTGHFDRENDANNECCDNSSEQEETQMDVKF